MDKVYDVAVIGGGINGCGTAADAALRGLSVVLCEQDDLASKTSSSSTKLIHGGLRYLEHYDFRMVKKALDERQILLEIAPHLVKPLRLLLPYNKSMRPAWILRLGLFVYDHLSRKNKLPKTRFMHRSHDSFYFSPLVETLTKGFFYYDCSTNDARLTITNAVQARKHGADIRPRTKLIHAAIINNQWHLTVKPKEGDSYVLKARSIINAAGPWVEPVSQLLSIPVQHKMALVKGSHLVTKKLYDGEHAYVLQHTDDRIVFVIPYNGNTMIGTTDIPFNTTLNAIEIDPDEIEYLLGIVNTYFKTRLTKGDIVDSWSGVRPLLDAEGKSPKALSRDYAFEYSIMPAPAVTIYGGKITTYRQLASEVVSSLRPVFPHLSKSKTAKTPLPGANLGHLSLSEYKKLVNETYPWLDNQVLLRYLNLYGTQVQLILKGKESVNDMGKKLARGVYQAEIDYLIEQEWAHTLEDILWRRTSLGLSLNDEEKNKIGEYIESRRVYIYM